MHFEEILSLHVMSQQSGFENQNILKWNGTIGRWKAISDLGFLPFEIWIWDFSQFRIWIWDYKGFWIWNLDLRKPLKLTFGFDETSYPPLTGKLQYYGLLLWSISETDFGFRFYAHLKFGFWFWVCLKFGFGISGPPPYTPLTILAIFLCKYINL